MSARASFSTAFHRAVLDPDEAPIQLLIFQPLDPLHARDEILAVALEHDRQIQIEETCERLARLRRLLLPKASSATRVSATRMSAIAVNV